MKSEEEIKEQFTNKNLDYDLHKDYVLALKDANFKSFVTKLKITEEVAMKYTSKLQNTIKELNNCKNCKNINNCQNKVFGCVNYPHVEGNHLRFDYVACKYKIKALDDEKHSTKIFEEPLEIRNARMGDIYTDDKKRMHIIRFVKKFYTDYGKNPNIKGCYLHGSFGSGKSFILAALLNELAKKDIKTTIIYYPKMLRILKESFNPDSKYDYDNLMELLEKSDVLLIDDIGAETVTDWSRDEILGTILQYRMDAKLPTFFTSNLTIEELEEHLSYTKGNVDRVKARRIIERIKQLTEDLELVSDNRRK